MLLIDKNIVFLFEEPESSHSHVMAIILSPAREN